MCSMYVHRCLTCVASVNCFIVCRQKVELNAFLVDVAVKSLYF